MITEHSIPGLGQGGSRPSTCTGSLLSPPSAATSRARPRPPADPPSASHYLSMKREGRFTAPSPPASVSPLAGSGEDLRSLPTQPSLGWPPVLQQTCQAPQNGAGGSSCLPGSREPQNPGPLSHKHLLGCEADIIPTPHAGPCPECCVPPPCCL